MKRILLLMIAGLFAFSAQAQFSKETFVLSGALTYRESNSFIGYLYSGGQFDPLTGFNYYTSNDVKTFSFSPRLGFFVSDDIEIGGMANYSFTQSEGMYSNETMETKSEGLLIGPYMRKYISLTDWASFYAQGKVVYGRSRSIYGDPGIKLEDSNGRTRFLQFGINPGVALRFNKIGVELQASLLNYTRLVSGLKDDFAESKGDPMVNWEFGPNLSNTSLGFSFYF